MSNSWINWVHGKKHSKTWDIWPYDRSEKSYLGLADQKCLKMYYIGGWLVCMGWAWGYPYIFRHPHAPSTMCRTWAYAWGTGVVVGGRGRLMGGGTPTVRRCRNGPACSPALPHLRVPACARPPPRPRVLPIHHPYYLWKYMWSGQFVVNFFLGAKKHERMILTKFQIFLTTLAIFSNFLLFNI